MNWRNGRDWANVGGNRPSQPSGSLFWPYLATSSPASPKSHGTDSIPVGAALPQDMNYFDSPTVVVVGFEVTILGSVFGNVLGLLTQTRLPSYRWFKFYDPRCSGEHFGVLASCEAGQEDGLQDFLKNQGAEVRVFE